MSRAWESRYVPVVPRHRALRIDFFEVPVVIKRARALRVVVRVPPQGRLALKCARRPFRPDLEGLVIAATDQQIAICAEADRPDTVFG